MLKTRAGAVIGTQLFDERDVLLTRKEAAGYLRKSVPTLERWAARGIGPRPLKLGHAVCYRLSDLRTYASGKAA